MGLPSLIGEWLLLITDYEDVFFCIISLVCRTKMKVVYFGLNWSATNY